MDPKSKPTVDIITDSLDPDMKTEAGLLVCAKQARLAVQGFTNVLNMTNPPASDLVIKGAMEHIVKSIVSLILFVHSKISEADKMYQLPFNGYTKFIDHPLFLELPTAAFNAINDYSIDHPAFPLPDKFNKVSGLQARVNDFAKLNAPSAKKGMYLSFCQWLSLLIILFCCSRYCCQQSSSS